MPDPTPEENAKNIDRILKAHDVGTQIGAPGLAKVAADNIIHQQKTKQTKQNTGNDNQ